VADELFEAGCYSDAAAYYDLFRHLPGEPDGHVLLQLGKCFMAAQDHARAEEYLLLAIEADSGSVDARMELAKIYESAMEEEEALILATEAMALQGADGEDGVSARATHAASRLTRIRGLKVSGPKTGSRAPQAREGSSAREARTRLKGVPLRYRPKRLLDPVARARDERARTERLAGHYQSFRELKGEVGRGNLQATTSWMASGKVLIDDFRSSRKLYSLGNYLRSIGIGVGGNTDPSRPRSKVTEMVERLSRSKPCRLVTTRVVHCVAN
jgi:general transcription factor 3C polypeptide 3 (transcription factor C subunit 4)